MWAIEREVDVGGGVTTAMAVLDNGTVAMAGERGKVRLWDVDSTTPACVAAVGGGGNFVADLAVMSGQMLAARCGDVIEVWDTAAHARAGTLRCGGRGGHCAAVGAMAVMGDQTVVTGGNDAQILAWDASTAKLKAAIGSLDKAVTALVATGHTEVASASTDDMVRLWDARARAAVAVMPTDSLLVTTLAANEAADVLVAAGAGSVHVWDARTRTLRDVVHKHGHAWMLATAVLPDDTIVAGSARGVSLIAQRRATRLNHTHVAAMAAMHGGRLAVADEDDGTLQVWAGAWARRRHALTAMDVATDADTG